MAGLGVPSGLTSGFGMLVCNEGLLIAVDVDEVVPDDDCWRFFNLLGLSDEDDVGGWKVMTKGVDSPS